MEVKKAKNAKLLTYSGKTQKTSWQIPNNGSNEINLLEVSLNLLLGGRQIGERRESKETSRPRRTRARSFCRKHNHFPNCYFLKSISRKFHKIYLVPLVPDVLWVYDDLPGLEPVLPVGPAAGDVVLPQVHRHLAEAEGDPEGKAARKMFTSVHWRVKLMNCMPRGILLAAEGGHAEAVRSRDHPPLNKKNNLNFKFRTEMYAIKEKGFSLLFLPEDIQPCFALLMRAPPHCGLPLPPPPLLHPPWPGTERWSSSRAMNGRLVVSHINFSNSTQNKKYQRIQEQQQQLMKYCRQFTKPNSQSNTPNNKIESYTHGYSSSSSSSSSSSRYNNQSKNNSYSSAAPTLATAAIIPVKRATHSSNQRRNINLNSRKTTVTITAAAAAKISNNKTIPLWLVSVHYPGPLLALPGHASEESVHADEGDAAVGLGPDPLAARSLAASARGTRTEQAVFKNLS